ncbi:amidohydrolase family protein [Roseimicrobium sp. ORNL1]|uniref:amidohydrolase family protein n=1 Tax=Roseimicrobium sp. ORNL1 TaxID=2711231 RepID=UPI0013E1A6A6|nr:amidohydrolase family protein [Roseimicrobium sp. ORNL1]QIF04241.1 amidohydrolase family protein [Roseimicrobium sp. ORNL1]
MNRRHFLRSTSLATAGLATASSSLPPSASAAAPYPIIDTHVHFYDPKRAGGVPWPPQNSPLYRTVLPDDWAKLAAPHGVTATVVVEASPLVEDNQWILDIASEDKRIVGLVGNLDPMAAEFAANIKRFVVNPLFCGIRNRRPNAELPDLVGQPQFIKSMQLMADKGLELDVNGPMDSQGEATAKLAETISDLRIVINHLGASGDPKSLRPGWKEGIKRASENLNVYCKVSALVEQTKAEYGKAPKDTAYYLPILDHLWECFGEDRLIYGSNWPVSDKGAGYDVVFRIVKEYFTSKGEDAARKYFYRNSEKAYRWVAR